MLLKSIKSTSNTLRASLGFVVITVVLSCTVGAVYADARSEITLENNCTSYVTFAVSGDNAGPDQTITLQPNDYKNI